MSSPISRAVPRIGSAPDPGPGDRVGSSPETPGKGSGVDDRPAVAEAADDAPGSGLPDAVGLEQPVRRKRESTEDARARGMSPSFDCHV
jgi:hypothetical protein